MPFKSKAQQKFAFATKKPWAKEWADKTPDMDELPDKVMPKPKGKSKPPAKPKPVPAQKRRKPSKGKKR